MAALIRYGRLGSAGPPINDNSWLISKVSGKMNAYCAPTKS